ncbi:sugar phosphate isomerase/epimerase family protein [Fontivita pretiosa]|uniref:sugar phosphate isomerase/epimerase family protein n=1 Tax=Fontivita pretiosa TaxID=2989684 RepID=UPI003D166168
MQVRGHDIAVCSWSLRPAGMAEMIDAVRQLGLEHVQLGLRPLLEMDQPARQAQIQQLRESGLKLTATMISFPGEDYTTIATIRQTGGLVPEDRWPERRDLTLRAAQLSAELGASLLTFHMGFIPASNDPLYRVMVQRARELATEVAAINVCLLMETGQESASELLQFLNDLNCRNVAVNFDPANMILYGAGDPIEAIGILNRHIRHVHVKDAIASSQPRMVWGTEVPFGTGQVGPARFLDALDKIGYRGPLAIEREAGENRLADIRAAIRALREAQ